jgi:hypothetical protein
LKVRQIQLNQKFIENCVPHICFEIGDNRSLSNDEARELKSWLKTALGDKVKNIKVKYSFSRRLVRSKLY